jgi:hypothetical protein
MNLAKASFLIRRAKVIYGSFFGVGERRLPVDSVLRAKILGQLSERLN